MGFLTTFTIYNDNLDQIRTNPEAFKDVIIHGACLTSKRKQEKPIGNACNAVIIQKPRHSDDHTLFMQAGNTVVDVYDANHGWALDQFILEMEYHLKRLKSIQKEQKDGK